MSAIFPEHKLKLITESLMNKAKNDLDANSGDETKSWLYSMFGGVVEEGVDYFEQAKKVLNDIYDETVDKKLYIKLGYSFNQEDYPVITIILPDEQFAHPHLSMNEEVENYSKDGSDYIAEVHEARFNTQYVMLVSSNNMDEVLIIHKLLVAFFVSSTEQYDLQGIRNPRVSSRDVSMQLDVPPPRELYHRGISVSFYYEQKFRSLVETEIPTDFTSGGNMYDD